MGDRGNIIIAEGNDKVYLYTHWTGHDLPDVLHKALLRGRERWDDYPYLARIIFCEMIRKDGLDKLTGFGITSSYGDGGYDITVDVENQIICMPDGRKATFEDFCKPN